MTVIFGISKVDVEIAIENRLF